MWSVKITQAAIRAEEYRVCDIVCITSNLVWWVIVSSICYQINIHLYELSYIQRLEIYFIECLCNLFDAMRRTRETCIHISFGQEKAIAWNTMMHVCYFGFLHMNSYTERNYPTKFLLTFMATTVLSCTIVGHLNSVCVLMAGMEPRDLWDIPVFCVSSDLWWMFFLSQCCCPVVSELPSLYFSDAGPEHHKQNQ